jgi:hypothetical protein
MKPWIALTLSLPCFVLGCESTGVGNPKSEMSVSVVNDLNPEPDATDTSDQLSPTEVRHAALAFSELRWVPCDAADATVVTPGPMVVDLVSGIVSPPLPTVPFPPGGFCGLDAPLTLDAPNAAMQGRSMLFSGTRSDGTLFILYAAMPGTIHMVPQPGVVWTAENARSVIWALRPYRWLRQTEIDAETADAFGATRRAIVIDVDRHPLLYAVIRSRIGGRSSMYEDTNHDQQVDPSDVLIGHGLPSLD